MILPLLTSAAVALWLGPSDSIRGVSRTPSTRTGATARAASGEAIADSIVVEKGLRRLTLFRRGVPVRSYAIALGRNPVGDKERVGDFKTPEGVFSIDRRNPQSRYHLSLRISYPSAAHRARARALGVSPGGDIMIHGLPAAYASVGAAHRLDDWTEGCIAVTNEEIEEIWRAIGIGTPIEIKP